MTAPTPGDAPDIVVLPPVLVLGTLALGLVVHFFLWTAAPFPVVGARVTGAALMIASGLLAHFAHRAMTRAGTNILPTRPTLALATDGPFRFTRNPLYLAAIGVYLAVSLWANALAPLLLLVPMALVLHHGVVLREERYLEGKFGEAYRAYCARVRRWL